MLLGEGEAHIWGGKGQAQGLPLPERFEETVTAAQEGVRGQAQGLPLPERKRGYEGRHKACPYRSVLRRR